MDKVRVGEAFVFKTVESGFFVGFVREIGESFFNKEDFVELSFFKVGGDPNDFKRVYIDNIISCKKVVL